MRRLTPIANVPSVQELPATGGRLQIPANGISNFLKLLAGSPASMKAFLQAESALAKGQLTPQQRESIALVVAAINGSNYCLAAHEWAGRQAGLSAEEILAAQKASATNPKTETLLHFVQAVVLQRGEVSEPDFIDMQKAGFSETEVIEVLANVVLNIFTNYFNILAQTELDGQVPPLEPKDLPAENLSRRPTCEHASCNADI